MRRGRGGSRLALLTSSTGWKHTYRNIVSKLDEVVESQWRDPDAFLEPLTGGPFSKLRVGEYRLACTLNHHDAAVEHRIEHRSGAYTAAD